MQHLLPLELSAYVDGESTPERRREIEVHVDACEVCRGALIQMRSLVETLDRLPPVDPPSDFSLNVLRRLTPYRPLRRTALVASLAFVLITLVGGASLIGLGLLADSGLGPRLAASTASVVQTSLALLRSTALVARVGWNLSVVLVDSFASLVLQQGIVIPLALVVAAVLLAYLLERSLQGYRKSRMA